MAANKKTPTPKYMAACLALDFMLGMCELGSEALTKKFESRVSPGKRDKVVDAYQKLVGKFEERCRKIKETFEKEKSKE